MRRSLVSLITGAVFAVVAVALMYTYINSAIRGAPQAGPAIELSTIVVAGKDLPFGTPIVKENLKLATWPKASIPDGAFTSIDDIFAGAKVPGDRIALVLVNHDEPVTRSRISGFGAKPTMSRQVDSSMRAVSIRIDDIVGVGGFVLPGDRVDVLLTRRVGAGTNNLATEIVLQNVTVLGIDQTADQQADKPIVARSATVEVSPEDAQKLTLAQQAGTLTLALRGAESLDTIQSKTITEADLGPKKPAPPPVVARPAPPRVAPPPVTLPAVPTPPKPFTVRVRYGDAP